MILSDTIVGASIGAISALGGALVSSVITFFIQRRQLKLQKDQLLLSAYAAFNARKMDAIVSIREAIQSLTDGDTNARAVYYQIRPLTIFLDNETERMISIAISDLLNGQSTEPASVGESIELLLDHLKAEIRRSEGVNYD